MLRPLCDKRRISMFDTTKAVEINIVYQCKIRGSVDGPVAYGTEYFYCKKNGCLFIALVLKRYQTQTECGILNGEIRILL